MINTHSSLNKMFGFESLCYLIALVMEQFTSTYRVTFIRERFITNEKSNKINYAQIKIH